MVVLLPHISTLPLSHAVGVSRRQATAYNRPATAEVSTQGPGAVHTDLECYVGALGWRGPAHAVVASDN